MARYYHKSRSYKGRRVVIRGKDGIGTDISQLEAMVRQDYDEIMKEHIEDLQEVAEQIQADATYLVPLATGALEASIDVHVSKGYRYPGIIAHASALHEGFDYALIQEENEEFEHTESSFNEKGQEVIDDSVRSAHYLGGPFALNISELYRELTGKELALPANLLHAKDYVEDKL